MASTGLAMVHAGEAIMPGADTLKRSIDALTSEMHANTGLLGGVLNWMISPMLGGRSSLPLRLPGIGTLAIPPLMASVANGTTASSGSGALSALDGGGYSPVAATRQ